LVSGETGTRRDTRLETFLYENVLSGRFPALKELAWIVAGAAAHRAPPRPVAVDAGGHCQISLAARHVPLLHQPVAGLTFDFSFLDVLRVAELDVIRQAIHRLPGNRLVLLVIGGQPMDGCTLFFDRDMACHAGCSRGKTRGIAGLFHGVAFCATQACRGVLFVAEREGLWRRRGKTILVASRGGRQDGEDRQEDSVSSHGPGGCRRQTFRIASIGRIDKDTGVKLIRC